MLPQMFPRMFACVFLELVAPIYVNCVTNAATVAFILFLHNTNRPLNTGCLKNKIFSPKQLVGGRSYRKLG